MRGVPVKKMKLEDLRDAVMVMNGGIPQREWLLKQCREWLMESGIEDLGVGQYCRVLLRVSIGKNREKFVVGLSYTEMKRLALVRYPYSSVDERHLQWYATSMRAAGEMIPVWRERSRWK